MKIPNVETGVRMATFEDVLHDYVRVRAQEYYKWKDYQYAIQYADFPLFAHTRFFSLFQENML